VAKILFYELEGWEREIIGKRLSRFNYEDISLKSFPVSEESFFDPEAEIISVFIYSRINSEIIDKFPSLRLIATRSTGFDHIDTEYARKKGIKVCNVPNYGDETVAEYTIALILSLLRKLKATYERVGRGIFSREGLRGEDFNGKTLGVIGTGRIGSKVIKIASAFEVDILCFDPSPKDELVKLFGVRYVGLENLLSQSDIITIHVPYTKSTHHLINSKNIHLLKKGSYLINTSRGTVVKTEAIIEAIKDGILSGVALDTFEGEEVWIEEELILGRPDISGTLLKKALENFYLLHWENVILTPHNAYNTKEALERILNTTIDNIQSFLNTGNPIYPI
jgi:D-lactate dehydrogenase